MSGWKISGMMSIGGQGEEETDTKTKVDVPNQNTQAQDIPGEARQNRRK